MSFIVRPLDENDYDSILVEWWKMWGWKPVERDFLPDDGKGGVIVYDEDVPVCAGFLYTTNSKVAWIDWIVSNKNYRKKPHRKEAISFLVETLTNISRNTGHKYGYALIKHQSLINTYKELGYVKGDEYIGELIKVL